MFQMKATFIDDIMTFLMPRVDFESLKPGLSKTCDATRSDDLFLFFTFYLRLVGIVSLLFSPMDCTKTH